jgi:isochorismate hydrolase
VSVRVGPFTLGSASSLVESSRRRSRKLLVAGGVFAMIGVMVYAFRSLTAEGPRLAVETAQVEMGTIAPGQIASRSASIRNVSKRVLRIHELQASCGCTQVELSRSELDPGESALLLVR